MNSTRHPPKWSNLVLVGLFAFALWLPTVFSLCRFQHAKIINEYRLPTAPPQWGDQLLLWLHYGEKLDSYYNDHFGCRDWLIASHLAISRIMSPTEVGPIVLVGRDGWLYYLSDDKNMINHHLGITRLPASRLEDLQAMYEQRRNLLAAHGIKYLVVIVPDKDSVYPEYLPGWLNVSAATKTDQFVDYMRTHSKVDLLYLGSGLREAAGREPLYYKTDTHWNLMGAFTAQEIIVSSISKQIPGLKPVGRGSFKILRGQGTGGDLARCAGELALIEANAYTFTPIAQMPGLKFEIAGTEQIDWPQFGSFPYPANNFITATNSQGTAQVIIFGDSFATTLVPFLACDFGRLVFIRHKFDDDLNFEVINQNKPDLVIDEVVERSIR